MAGKIDNLIGKLVLIDWVDSAVVLNGWKHLGGALQDRKLYNSPPIASVGFVVKATKKLIVLAPTVGNDCVAEEIVIPRVAVLRQTILKSPGGKQAKETLKAATKMIRGIAMEVAA